MLLYRTRKKSCLRAKSSLMNRMLSKCKILRVQSASVTGYVLPALISIFLSDKSAIGAGVIAIRQPQWSCRIRVSF
jgi:hypothetical protein